MTGRREPDAASPDRAPASPGNRPGSSWWRRLVARAPRRSAGRGAKRREARCLCEEVDEELATHIELRARDLEADGMPRDAALQAARERFGDVARISRQSLAHRRRAQRASGPAAPGGHGGGPRWTRWVDDLRSDLRHGARALARRPGFALAAVATLGLGIGVATAVFGLHNALLARPVPGLPDAEALVKVLFHREQRLNFTWVSYPNYLDLLEAADAFEAAAGYRSDFGNVSWANGAAAPAGLDLVTHDYFDVLGVPMSLGRGFTREEGESPAAGRVAVLTHDFWHDRTGAADDVIDSTIRVNRQPFRVVGVTGPGFRGVERFDRADVFLPASAYGDTAPFVDPGPDLMSRREQRLLDAIVGRLRPGATPEQLEAQVGAAFEGLVAGYPEENRRMQGITPRVHEAGSSVSFTTESLESTLVLMGWVVTAVLLIATANVANLLLSRQLRRRQELSVRRALGASTGRIVRQLLAESILLGLLGGAVGLVLALWLHRGIALLDIGVAGVETAGWMPVDLRVLAFTVVAAVVVGIVTGLGSLTLSDTEAGVRTATDGRGRRVRDGLTALQFATSLTLLIGALLLVRSVQNLREHDRGFEPSRVATVQYSLDAHQYSDAETRAFLVRLRDVLEEMQALGPHALAASVPFSGIRNRGRIRVEGTLLEGGDEETALFAANWVTSGYFEALGIPILRGRTFGPGDLALDGTSRSEIILSRQLARELFGEDEPLGKIIREGGSGEYPPRTVVGIVGEVSRSPQEVVPEPTMYVPFEHHFSLGTARLLARPPEMDAGLEALTGLFRSLDPTLPTRVATVQELLEGRIEGSRTVAGAATFLAALALVLAAVGLHAVMAFSVADRTRELGIRIALGADARRLTAGVLGRATRIAGVGVALGLLAAWGTSRYLASRLYEVEPTDPTSYGLAAVVLLAVGIGASLLPARRATSVDPLVAMRAE